MGRRSSGLTRLIAHFATDGRLAGRTAAKVALTLALVATLALSLAVPASPTTANPLPQAPTPVVVGNHLIDTRTNQVFTVHGVNWPSFEYACTGGWGYSGGYSLTEAQAIASWGVNAVRIPLNQSCWLGLDGSPSFGTKAGYRAALLDWVNTLNSAGLVAILDLHWSAPAGYEAIGQRAMPDAQSLTLWSSVAGVFHSNPSVMFDAFNEPYSRWNNATHGWTFQLTWGCWRNGECYAPVENDSTATLSGTTYPVTGMASLVTAIRSAGAAQPIMLGGLDYSNDLRGWVANAPDDDQLVASWHNYPGQRCSNITCWNAEIAPVAAVVPVVTGEFGETDGGSSYLTAFMNWADAHGVGYAPWAWWKVSDAESLPNSRYALVDDPGFTPKAPSGTTYHDHLASLAAASLTVNRVSGANRYATALAVASNYDPGVTTVYVATGQGFADSLSAAAAAGALDAPLILSPQGSLAPGVSDEILRLSPANIVVVGGTASLSASVYQQLSQFGIPLRRDAGGDRYATSREIVRNAFSGGAASAYIATGRTFADALSAAAAAGSQGIPVILVDGLRASVDAQTLQLLADLGVKDVVIVGRTGAVSGGIETVLTQQLGSGHVTRIGGADRYATSIALNRAAFTTPTTVFLATGISFPDALSGAALAGKLSAPLYVVPGVCIPQGVLDDITALGATSVTLLGGTGVLSPAVAALTRC